MCGLENVSIIGIESTLKNKMNESGKVVQNKSHLVAQGYLQQDKINYDKTSSLVVRLESIRILFANVDYNRFL